MSPPIALNLKRQGDKAYAFTCVLVPTCHEIALGIAEVRSVMVTCYGKTRKEARVRGGLK